MSKRKYGRCHIQKKKIKRVAISCCVFICVVIGTAFQTTLYNCIQNCENRVIQLTGAYVKTVIITGASPKVEKLIRANLGIKAGDSIFSVSTINMLNNVLNIGWIKDATIHKVLPNIIKINVKERVPIAVYYHNQQYSLIDTEGILIEQVASNPGLPLTSGTNANVKINGILGVLTKYPSIKVYSLTYVQNRRWNLVLNNKVVVKLPSKNIDKALENLSRIINQKNITQLITEIDLRVDGNIIIRGLRQKTTKNPKKHL